MTLEQKTNYLITNRVRVPILKPMTSIVLSNDSPTPEPVKHFDISEYAQEVFHYVTALQKQNTDLLNTLKDLAKNDFNIHYFRESKRELVKKYFPELLASLPYYAGGGSNE